MGHITLTKDQLNPVNIYFVGTSQPFSFSVSLQFCNGTTSCLDSFRMEGLDAMHPHVSI